MKFTWVGDKDRRRHYLFTNYRAEEARVWVNRDRQWAIIAHDLSMTEGATTLSVRRNKELTAQIPCMPLCVAFVVKEIMDMADVFPGNVKFAQQVRALFRELAPVADERSMSAYQRSAEYLFNKCLLPEWRGAV